MNGAREDRCVGPCVLTQREWARQQHLNRQGQRGPGERLLVRWLLMMMRLLRVALALLLLLLFLRLLLLATRGVIEGARRMHAPPERPEDECQLLPLIAHLSPLGENGHALRETSGGLRGRTHARAHARTRMQERKK